MKKIFLLLLPIALLSCSSDDDNTPVATPVNPNAVAYIRGNANGQAIDYSYTLDASTPSYYGFNNGFSGVGSERVYYYGGGFSPASVAGVPQLMLSWNNLVTGTAAEESVAFQTAFETNIVNYITTEQDNAHIKGVEFSYEAENGEYYSTMEGSQNGSTFTIASSVSGVDTPSGLRTQTITGTFSCKMYNYDNAADVIEMSGGTYKVILREYN